MANKFERSCEPHLVHVGGIKPLLDGGNLADLASTMLVILGEQQPAEMPGRSLIGQ